MPRQPRPENKIAEDLKPLIQKARDEIGLEGRSYRKRDGKDELRVAYGVKTGGDLPHYATDEQAAAAKEGSRIVFDDVWQAIWLAAGTSDKSEIQVLVKKTSDAPKPEGDAAPEPPKVTYKAVDKLSVAAAKDLFPDRVDGESAIVR
jgi:hypothetical protein